MNTHDRNSAGPEALLSGELLFQRKYVFMPDIFKEVKGPQNSISRRKMKDSNDDAGIVGIELSSLLASL